MPMAAGIILSNLRLKGLSLFWLFTTHTLIDNAYFFFKTDAPGFFSIHHLVLLTGMILYAWITYPKGLKSTLHGINDAELLEESGQKTNKLKDMR
jgi:hypothetical protein